ncbi:phage gp6-like head-tail connector protein [Paracoccus liaowanqingii]|uniref:Phage gp6-like head-tail connector protein n=1 Tax=Paracoccus liaowanqingii TaxID=2560053 RepID=A0A4Z1CSP6_9RHOB|nr:head-tail connector protein [Paracoccus liaowanqingii]TGN68274.1 phage gp6-like head-tail connector protein [Paracoccus liaowanqingii]
MPLPIALIRAHLVIDHEDDDQILTHYSNVAAMWVAAYTGQPFDPANALMAQAALLLVATQYESREAVTFSNAYQLPFGVHDLLSPLKERVTGYVAPVAEVAA